MVQKSTVVSCFVCASLQVGVLFAQQVQSPKQGTPSVESVPAADYRVTKLVLSPGKPVSGLDGSHIFVRPLQCTATGDALVEIPTPPAFRDFSVNSLSRSGGRAFDFKTIPGLYDLQLFSFFPSDSDVAFLFHASEENKESDYRMETDEGQIVAGRRNRTEHHEYVVRFGLDGQYKSKTMLPSGKLYYKVAVLPSGELLLLSYDQANRTPVLQALDESGRPVNAIPLQGGLVNDAAIDRGRSGDALDAAKASMSVASWQFIPARGKVLLYRPNANAPILEIGNGGSAREVPVEGPRGYELDSFVPSTKHWFAIFRRSGIGGVGSSVDSRASSKNFLMAELNPSDGSVERLFEMDSGSFFDIACEADGQFISYSVDDSSSKFLLSYTDVPN
jgi:hypothetical protein